MRDAKPGMNEYELQADAEFVFKKYGAYGPSYFALDRDRTEHAATRTTTRTRATLQDGDLVQFDYAPDYKNYSVGRDARLPGQRPVHAAAARVLRHLSAAVSGADDIDQGARRAAATS